MYWLLWTNGSQQFKLLVDLLSFFLATSLFWYTLPIFSCHPSHPLSWKVAQPPSEIRRIQHTAYYLKLLQNGPITIKHLCLFSYIANVNVVDIFLELAWSLLVVLAHHICTATKIIAISTSYIMNQYNTLPREN